MKLRYFLKDINWSSAREINAYRKGIAAAASFAGEYNSLCHHPCRIDDCILAKFNLIKGKPRRNRKMKWGAK